MSGTMQGAGGIGGLLARTDSSGTAFYHSDAGGNVTTMTDSSGNVVARYLYDPYGNLLAKSGPLADVNKYRFSSKEVHPNSGLYSYGYRFYEPNLQRWLNPDPIGIRGGMNLFQAFANSPLNVIDPDGRDNMYHKPDPNFSCTVNNNVVNFSASMPLGGGPVSSQAEGTDPLVTGAMMGGFMSVTTVATLFGGLVPGVGEYQDYSVATDPNSTEFEKSLARFSLQLNAATGGFSPNAGSILRCRLLKESSRRRALDAAQEHAQVPRKPKGGEEFGWDDLNDKGENSARIRSEGATHRGRRDTGSKAKFEDHPDGHPKTPGPSHHDSPHVHAVDKKGEEVIITYPPGT